MGKIRVMVLGLRGFPQVEGGVETHAENLYPLLVELGCDVEIVVRKRYAYHEKMWRGVRFSSIWAPTEKGYEAFVHSILGVLYAGFRRPDILHIHAIGPAIATPLARLLGLRVVVTHHGQDYDRDKWGRAARIVLRMGEAAGMRFSHGRIAISRVIQNLIRTKYRMDSTLIPNGVVVTECPQSIQTLHQFGLTPGKYVLQVSRLVPEKRQIDLMKAFRAAKLGDWKLALVGSSPGDDSYKRLVVESAASDDRIVLTGFQTGEALRELYGHAGLFVLPSSHEGLPIALLEAMSYGIPVLASNIPANCEVGLPEDCYFAVGDIEALQQLLHKTTALGFNMGQRENQLRMVREHYDWHSIAAKTLELYTRFRDVA